MSVLDRDKVAVSMRKAVQLIDNLQSASDSLNSLNKTIGTLTAPIRNKLVASVDLSTLMQVHTQKCCSGTVTSLHNGADPDRLREVSMRFGNSPYVSSEVKHGVLPIHLKPSKALVRVDHENLTFLCVGKAKMKWVRHWTMVLEEQGDTPLGHLGVYIVKGDMLDVNLSDCLMYKFGGRTFIGTAGGDPLLTFARISQGNTDGLTELM